MRSIKDGQNENDMIEAKETMLHIWDNAFQCIKQHGGKKRHCFGLMPNQHNNLPKYHMDFLKHKDLDLGKYHVNDRRIVSLCRTT